MGADRGAARTGRAGLRGGAAAVLLAAIALVALAGLVACGDAGGAPSTPSPPPAARSPTSRGELPAGDPGVAVRNVVQACREKDGDRLRSFVAGDVPDAEIDALFARGTDVQLLSQTVPTGAEQPAEVTVGLRIRHNGDSEQVERRWELERGDDGVWRLTELPDCF